MRQNPAYEKLQPHPEGSPSGCVFLLSSEMADTHETAATDDLGRLEGSLLRGEYERHVHGGRVAGRRKLPTTYAARDALR